MHGCMDGCSVRSTYIANNIHSPLHQTKLRVCVGDGMVMDRTGWYGRQRTAGRDSYYRYAHQPSIIMAYLIVGHIPMYP